MAEPLRIDNLRRRVQKDPASIAFAQLAEECRRAGALDEAIAVCRSGLERHPGYLSARVTLGRALFEIGRLDEAQHELQTVLSGAPNNLPALRGLGEIAQRRGDLKSALAHYRRALGLARSDPDMQQLVADLTRQVARVPAGVAVHASKASPKPDQTGLLSLDELARELLQFGNEVPARPSHPRPTLSLVGPATSAPPPFDPQREADLHTLATLERWLTAIDDFRAERHP